jgi:hypothetical protein
MIGANAGICFPNMRGERREKGRAHGSKWPGLSSPSPWALFIGEVKMAIYSLFHWWGEILHLGPQIFTKRSLKAVKVPIHLIGPILYKNGGS